ncbi:hypothetical protein M9H77_03102 [Catharanthus roseus]|uniref:Uncharacterized protein n=1 Tax=Catharanthus roseus TaxID=4058 RepID=A0ACC0CA81_CATRO|nr:hypothetical protein M9H77_03102 [Catharanthus roseus]
MDVLNDTKLLEGNPHLILEGRHWCSRRFILVREVIGLIVLTLLLIRLQGGHSYTVVKCCECDDRKRGLIMKFIKHIHINNMNFTLSTPPFGLGVPEKVSEGTGKNGTKVTPWSIRR